MKPQVVLAIDPGDEQSAWVMYSQESELPLEWGLEVNEEVRDRLRLNVWDTACPQLLLMEYTPPYTLQMQNGRSYVPNQVAMTAFEAGRMVQCADHLPHVLFSRTDVKKWLLGRATGNDAAIRDAIYHKYGGSRKQAMGLKDSPGPLYGLVKDCMAAFAVAVAHHQEQQVKWLHEQPF